MSISTHFVLLNRNLAEKELFRKYETYFVFSYHILSITKVRNDVQKMLSNSQKGNVRDSILCEFTGKFTKKFTKNIEKYLQKIVQSGFRRIFLVIHVSSNHDSSWQRFIGSFTSNLFLET